MEDQELLNPGLSVSEIDELKAIEDQLEAIEATSGDNELVGSTRFG